MRKFAVALALATTALAGPAFAKDKAFYIGVDAGGLLVEDTKFDIRNAAGTATVNSATTLDHDYGFDVGGNVGYDFGAFRTELEVSYKDARVQTVRVQGSLPTVLANGTVGIPATGAAFNPADGNSRVLAFMLNGMFDFGGKDGGISGFVGGGVGVARVKLDHVSLAKGGASFMDDSDTGFAYQALAGLRMPLSPPCRCFAQVSLLQRGQGPHLHAQRPAGGLALPQPLVDARPDLQLLRRDAAGTAAGRSGSGRSGARAAAALPARCSDPGAVPGVFRLGSFGHHAGKPRRSSIAPPSSIARPVRRASFSRVTPTSRGPRRTTSACRSVVPTR